MNSKERLAGAVLVLTLAVGIFVDVWEREAGPGAPEAGPSVSLISEPGQASPEDSAGPASAAGEAGAAGSTAEYRKMDVNRATSEELQLLPGIGPKKAEAVIAWRQAHGPFKSLEALMDVKGIGRATLERLRPYASVGQ